MSEEEQVLLASRLGVIEQLPTGAYVESASSKAAAAAECVICLSDFCAGDALRYLERNSTDIWNFRHKTGCKSGASSGQNSVLGHCKFTEVSFILRKLS